MKTSSLLRQGCIALWIAGCASSPTSPPTVRADRARAAPQRREVDQRPGYRARVRARVASAGGRSSDSWTDIVVLDASDRGRRVCEALAERQVAALTGSTLDARLERACGAEPLPEPTMIAGTHLLIDERRLTELDALVAMAQEPDDAAALGEASGSGRATITQQKPATDTATAHCTERARRGDPP